MATCNKSVKTIVQCVGEELFRIFAGFFKALLAFNNAKALHFFKCQYLSHKFHFETLQSKIKCK